MVLFLTGTPGPGAHYHVDNVDLSSWQVEMFVKSLYQNVILILIWEWMVWITGTTEGCEDLEASISTRVLDVLSWGDSDHPLSWGHHHCQHQYLVPLYQGFEFRSMESNDDDLGNGLLSNKTKYFFLDGPLPTTCRKCPNKVSFKNQKGILWTLRHGWIFSLQ